MAAKKGANAAATLDVPGAACDLLAPDAEQHAAGGEQQAPASAGGGLATPSGEAKVPRQLRPQGTRTPPEVSGASPAASAAPSEADNHDNETEHGEDDAPMDAKAVDAEAGETSATEEATTDIDNYVKHLSEQIDAKTERIQVEHSTAIAALGKKIEGQLRQQREQMTKPSAQVDEGRKHTERVRLQVVLASHTADTRDAESTRKQDALVEKVDNLNEMVMNLLKGGAVAPGMGHVRHAARMLRRLRGHREAAVTQRCGRAREDPQGSAWLRDDAHGDPPERVESGRTDHWAQLRGEGAGWGGVDELVDALRDHTGQWRALDAQAAEGTTTRVYLGRDEARSQLHSMSSGCPRRMFTIAVTTVWWSSTGSRPSSYSPRRRGLPHCCGTTRSWGSSESPSSTC